MVYTKTPSSTGGQLMLSMTRGDGTNAQLRWEATTRFDNQWFVSEGGASLYAWRPGATAEGNLRLATVFRKGSSDKWLEFRPKADGIANVALKDADDYALMERGLCSALKQSCTSAFCLAPGETSSCPAR